jgi:hypothetical protein
METGDKQGKTGRPGTFPPGVSGNPNGRPPRGWTWKELLIEAAEEAKQGGEPAKKLLARKLVEKGLEGDVAAIKEFGDRIDGKSMQSTDLTSGGEKITGLTIELVRGNTEQS